MHRWQDQRPPLALPSSNKEAWILSTRLTGNRARVLLCLAAALFGGAALAQPPPPGTSTLLSVTGGPLTFNYQIGSSLPGAQNLYASVSSGTASFTASSNQSWLQVNPAGGTLATGATALSVSINPAGLSAGPYFGSITINAPNASNGSQNVIVTLTVTNFLGLPLFTTGPIPDGCQVPSTATQFTSDTTQIYAWVQFSGASIGDQVTWNWYDPNQVLRFNTATTITFNGDGCAWSWISVSGTSSAAAVGTWNVDYLYNGGLLGRNNFQLSGPGVATASLVLTGGPLAFSYQTGSSL